MSLLRIRQNVSFRLKHNTSALRNIIIGKQYLIFIRIAQTVKVEAAKIRLLTSSMF